MVNTYRNDTLDRGGGDWLFDKEEGTLIERLRISRMSRMVDRDGDGATWKGAIGFFFIIEQEIMTEKGWFFIKKA